MSHQNNLDVEILQSKKHFTIILNDGEEWMCKLLAIDRYNLHIETEKGEILLPKHSVKYYLVEEQVETDPASEPEKPAEEKKETPTSLKLEEIRVPTMYQKRPPNPNKIDHALSFYKEHGAFDKPVEVKETLKGWMLSDGYTRYLAAQKLDMEEIPVRVLGSSGEERKKGKVKHVKHDDNYGFIILDEGKDIFFHRTALANVKFEDLVQGTEVECIVEEKPRGLQAALVRKL